MISLYKYMNTIDIGKLPCEQRTRQARWYTVGDLRDRIQMRPDAPLRDVFGDDLMARRIMGPVSESADFLEVTANIIQAADPKTFLELTGLRLRAGDAVNYDTIRNAVFGRLASKESGIFLPKYVAPTGKDQQRFEESTREIIDAILKCDNAWTSFWRENIGRGLDKNSIDLTGAVFERKPANALFGLNLSQTHYLFMSFNGLVFDRSRLWCVDLSGKDLIGASFRNASLVAANLERAYLKGADFSGASLFGAKLREAVADARDRELFQRSNVRDITLNGMIWLND